MHASKSYSLFISHKDCKMLLGYCMRLRTYKKFCVEDVDYLPYLCLQIPLHVGMSQLLQKLVFHWIHPVCTHTHKPDTLIHISNDLPTHPLKGLSLAAWC
uniref:Uncharacterized protein n=1 Tax=Stegastes partitus TaxID=144197 RepID=A0A3B5AI89_9TELE